jgi:hypothetical protein
MIHLFFLIKIIEINSKLYNHLHLLVFHLRGHLFPINQFHT